MHRRKAKGKGELSGHVRILIINRGEIACRIVKTARKIGTETEGFACVLAHALKNNRAI